ncbi:MAG: rod shape-determining protein MreD [bacterium]|nr:rod shape-determining protein MreD [bacterium]
MREKILFFLIIVLFAFTQATVLAVNFVLLLVLSWGVVRPAKSGLIWAVLAGLILDLINGEALGSSSLIFLFLIFLVNSYKAKFKATHFVYLVPFMFFSAWFYNVLLGYPLQVLNVIATTVFLLLIWPLVNILVVERDTENLQLPLKI